MNHKILLPSLGSLKKVHIIGVCGTLMGAFAAYLKRRGIHVSGSDQNIYPPMSDVLRNAGVELLNGYRPENLQADGQKPDLVVIGNVIRSDNPEARAAIDGGHAYSSLPEAMEQLFLPQTRNLVVAGTHGKTTTSSLLAYTLGKCGQDPNYFIGGVSHDLPFSFQLSSIDPDRLFVLEGDEYDTAFWDKVPKFNHYLPDDVILTSIEYDHADIYPDFAAVVQAFRGLLSRIRSGGRIIPCFDYPIIRELIQDPQNSKLNSFSYGSSPDTLARFTPGKIRFENGFSHFKVLDHEKEVDELMIQLPGKHNILNALSVWIECQQLGMDSKLIHEAFSSFRGVKRRQEIRGELNGILVMDDFAHHPTAVRETLQALRLKYPKHRILAVFEPRSATSRRKIFQKSYAEAFQAADLVFIANPFDQSRISKEDQFSSEMLVNDLTSIGKTVSLISTVESGVADVAQTAKSGDLIAVLSNGGFGGFIDKLIQTLKNH